ncbi:MAG TPA: hypothetical protein VN598_07150 [Usitatibacter sp.]|nr:hypothetical protein [Usitatibacter sp.]
MPGRAWFKQWEFEYDRHSTAAVYSGMTKSAAEACGCGDCLEWVKVRDSAFTPEVRRFFVKVGIDATRETSMSGLMLRDNDPSSYRFFGTYHFLGRLLVGPQSKVPLGARGYQIENMTIGPRLRAGLTSIREMNPDVPPKFRNREVITVTFEYGALE